VQARLERAGVVGLGESTPLDRYGEDVQTASKFIIANASVISQVLADSPLALERLDDVLGHAPGFRAAKAAIDAAAHDLAARSLGLPVWRMLGLDRVGPPSSWTVWLGDPDDMARRAEAASRRFRRIKVKLGGRDGLDLERATAVRSATRLPLTADVNEGWDFDEAVEGCRRLSDLAFEYAEQPLPASHERGAALKQLSPLPVYVDEDCHTSADLARCAQIAHGVNIKLAKSGGIREAIRMVHTARGMGLDVMVGCMGESGLGIAPAAAIASLFDYVDLDGNLLLAVDPHLSTELVDGVQVPRDLPGFGVELERTEWLGQSGQQGTEPFRVDVAAGHDDAHPAT
jgi:L-alanine-DL-glutamate epimerase-like enolase superfamily enzyme